MIAGCYMIEERRKRVREDRAWLSPPDPSINHNIASNAQHQGTATWFFEGDIFTEWKSKSTGPLLWIYGKRAPMCFLSPPKLTASNYHSRFGEERALVCYHLSCSPPRNLHRQLALQSSKI